MAEIAVFDYTSQMLQGVFITLTFICASLYLYRGYLQEDKKSRDFLYGFGLAYLGLALNLTIYYFMYEHIEGYYVDNTFYAFFENGGVIIKNPVEYEMIVRIGAVFTLVGQTVLFFFIEKNIKKTRYIMTITIFGLGCITFFVPLSLAFLIQAYSAILFFMFAISIVIYFIKVSKLELKAIGSLLFFGMILTLFASTIGGDTGKSLNIFPLWFAAILNIMGVIIIMLPLLAPSRHFTKAIKYWFIISAITVGMAALVYISIFIIGFENLDEVGRTLYIQQGLVLLPFMAIAIILSFLSIRKAMRQDQSTPSKMQEDILKLFSRPQKLTEEEVSVAMDKKICLVCRNKLARDIYLCPGCSALYCKKCASTLANMENECWACNVPFDESKPVKKKEYKEEELAMGIAIENNNNKKN